MVVVAVVVVPAAPVAGVWTLLLFPVLTVVRLPVVMAAQLPATPKAEQDRVYVNITKIDVTISRINSTTIVIIAILIVVIIICSIV